MRVLFIGMALTIISLGPCAAVAQSFNGYPCTQDCSGHEAGYEWAERQGIDDPDDCSGNSNSFIEGCQAWADEQQEQDDSGSSWTSSPDQEDDEGTDY